MEDSAESDGARAGAGGLLGWRLARLGPLLALVG
jgi:hypothetical protein